MPHLGDTNRIEMWRGRSLHASCLVGLTLDWAADKATGTTLPSGIFGFVKYILDR